MHKSVGNAYRPSNGDEGMWFIDKFCSNCIHGKYEHTGNTKDNPCDILSRSFCFDLKHPDYPKEWIYNDKGSPCCTAHVHWDWNRDDDGYWNDPPVPPTDDPNQLVLPFAINEIALTPDLQTA
jgi:hypothetical protein